MATRDGHPGLFERTLDGIFWTGFGTGGQGLVQFGVVIVLARLLTPAEFGIVSAAMVVVGLSTIFSRIGVGPALVQRPAIDAWHVRTAFTMSVGLGALVYGLVYASAPWVEAFFRMDGLARLLRVAALIFPVRGLAVVSESLAQRELQFRFLSALTVVSVACGYAPFGVAIALLGFGPYALVGAHLATAVVYTGALLARRRHSLVPGLQLRAARELLAFGAGMTAARLGNYTALQGGDLIVGRLLGAGSLGIYGRALQLTTIPSIFVGAVLDTVLFPAMSRIQEDRTRLAAAYRRALSAVALMMAPASVFMVAFATELVALALGEAWMATIVPLQILATGMLFRTSYRIADALTRAIGAVYRRAWRQWVYAGAILGLAAIGSRWGVEGVAAGVTVAVCVNYGLMTDLSRRLTGLSWRELLVAHLPGIRLGLACAAIGLALKVALPPWGPAATLATAAACFALVIVAAWRRLPGTFLGDEGRWFLARLASRFPWVGWIWPELVMTRDRSGDAFR